MAPPQCASAYPVVERLLVVLYFCMPHLQSVLTLHLLCRLGIVEVSVIGAQDFRKRCVWEVFLYSFLVEYDSPFFCGSQISCNAFEALVMERRWIPVKWLLTRIYEVSLLIPL